VDDMFKTVMDHVATMLGAEYAKLMLVDERTNFLYTRSSSQDDSMNTQADGTRLELAGEGSVAAKAVRTGSFYNIADLPNSTHYRPELHDNYRGTGMQVKSILCVPILSFDASDNTSKPIGVLQIINKRGAEKFSTKDENVVAALCSHISIGLGASDGDDKGFRQILSMCELNLNAKGVRMNAAENARSQMLYEQVMRDITEMTGAAATLLLVQDDNSDDLILKVSDKIPFFRNAPHKGVMGKVVDQQKTIIVNDLPRSPYYDPDRHENYQGTGIGLTSVVSTPCMSTAGTVIGVLECFKDKNNEFLPEDVNLLESAAAAIAIHLEGSGASLRRVLAEMHKLQSRGREAGVSSDCSNEVQSILESTASLVKKAGGQIEFALPLSNRREKAAPAADSRDETAPAAEQQTHGASSGEDPLASG